LLSSSLTDWATRTASVVSRAARTGPPAEIARAMLAKATAFQRSSLINWAALSASARIACRGRAA
jgi:hypothetical protein